MTDTDAGLAALQSFVVPTVESDDHDDDAPRQADADGNPIPDAPDAPEEMGPDQFWEMYQAVFGIAAAMPIIGPIPELAIQDHERAQARLACDATYRLLKAYAPSFFAGDRQQLMDWMLAGGFLFVKIRIVSVVLKVRQIEAQERAKPKPQNVENGPDPDADKNSPLSQDWENNAVRV